MYVYVSMIDVYAMLVWRECLSAEAEKLIPGTTLSVEMPSVYQEKSAGRLE